MLSAMNTVRMILSLALIVCRFDARRPLVPCVVHPRVDAEGRHRLARIRPE